MTWSLRMGTKWSWGMSLSSAHSSADRCSLLEHPAFREVQKQLEMGGDSNGGLAKVALHILKRNLMVSRQILFLKNASTPACYTRLQEPPYKELQELVLKGDVKIKGFTRKDREDIQATFKTLIRRAKVDKSDLDHIPFMKSRKKLFNLQRVLVGFYLIQGLDGGERRLPVEVVGELGRVLASGGGSYSLEEDRAILAWVGEHGARDWAQLAARLGRNYKSAGSGLQQRHHLLRDRLGAKKAGTTAFEDLAILTTEVLKENPNILCEMIPTNVDWDRPSNILNWRKKNTYETFRSRIHPLLRRYIAGTLEVDVRPLLLETLKREGWVRSPEIDFDWMARQEGFQGHTACSLERLFHGMKKCTTKAFGLSSTLDVTLKHLEDYWASSSRREKNSRELERERVIIEAYKQVMKPVKTL